MGTLTVNSMLAEIVRGVGNRTDLTASSSRVIDALNLAQEELTTVLNWQELEASIDFVMVANDPKVAFSAIGASFNPKEIYSLRIVDSSDRSNSRKLQQLPTRSYDQVIADPQYYSGNTPVAFMRWNDTFEFFPTPDEAYPCTLRIYNWPSTLVAGTGKSDFDHKDRILIHLAIHYLLQIEAEEERAKNHWNIVYGNGGLMQKLLTEDQEDPDVEVVGVSDPHGRRRGQLNVGNYWLNPFVNKA